MGWWESIPGGGQPYIQVDADLWIVMREDPHPRAVIKRVLHFDGHEQFLLLTWQLDPAVRKIVRIYDSLEDANQSVRWRNPKPETPTMPEHLRQPNPNAQRLAAQTRES